MGTRKKLIILGHEILPGKGAELNLDVAKLHTSTPIQVPVIVQRAKVDGPVLLLMAGMHGDEINGTEIVRRMIRKGWNKPTAGTVICIPVFNIFGFLNVFFQIIEFGQYFLELRAYSQNIVLIKYHILLTLSFQVF